VPQDIVREKVREALQGALEAAKRKGLLTVEPLPAITLDAPKRPEWGDFATPTAMILAPLEKRSPHDVAQLIVEHLPNRESVFDRVDIARPGFVNMTVKRDLWLEVLREIEREGARYGRTDIGRGQRVLIEFVSANPTGPLHVGHGRGAAVGQAVANLLEAAGYDVVREYYINDAGRQMRLLGASVFARYQQIHAMPAAFPNDGYHGAYVEELAAHLRDRVGASLLTLAPEEA